MKNVTISMNERLLGEARVAAARAGLSMSRFLSGLVEQGLHEARQADMREERRARQAALERFLAGPKLDISAGGHMPSAEDRHARR
jgi:hypothetical protein